MTTEEQRTCESAGVLATLPGRRLVNGKMAAGKVGSSYRNWLRLCDAGRAPWGLKLGGLRRWDLAELDNWIFDGCKPVRRPGKGVGHE